MPNIILLPVVNCSIKIIAFTAQITLVRQIHCEGI